MRLIIYILGVLFLPIGVLVSQEERFNADWSALHGRFSTSSMAADQWGNVYVVGGFRDTTDVDPGPGVTLEVPYWDGENFVQKLDPNGNLIWSKKLNGLSCSSIAVDTEGNCYLTGSFNRLAGIETPTGRQKVYQLGQSDFFIVKISKEGEFEWINDLGGRSKNHGVKVVAREPNEVYVLGSYKDTITIDVNGEQLYLNATGVDGHSFVAKIGEGGKYEWFNPMASDRESIGQELIIDKDGALIASGRFNGRFYYTVDGVEHTLIGNTYTGSDAKSIYIRKLSSDGEHLWAKQFASGGSDYSSVSGLDQDSEGNLYFTGSFQGRTDFDPEESVEKMVDGLDFDAAFLLKLNQEGEFLWVKVPMHEGEIQKYVEFEDALISDQNDLYVMGSFRFLTDFDLTEDTYLKESIGALEQGFLMRMDTAGKVEFVQDIRESGKSFIFDLVEAGNGEYYVLSHCLDSMRLNGFNLDKQYRVEGNILNWGSILFKVKPCTNSSDTVQVDTCGFFYTPSGKLLINSGMYSDTLVNAIGCDSVLFIQFRNTRPENAFVQYDTVQVCDTSAYYWDVSKSSYSVSGDYAFQFGENCDSTWFLHLRFLNTDFPVRQSSGEISVEYSSSKDYQWYRYDTVAQQIEGAASNQFTPEESGVYYCEISEGECLVESHYMEVELGIGGMPLVLFGTTERGGENNRGQLFKTDINGNNYQSIFSFSDSLGSSPLGILTEGMDGMLYGNTYRSGLWGAGAFFRVDPFTHEVEIVQNYDASGEISGYSFDQLELASDGMLYAIETRSGNLVQYDTEEDTMTVVTTALEGKNFYAGLCESRAGDLYGVTMKGGKYDQGIIYRFRDKKTFETLHSFRLEDGGEPYEITGKMVEASNGILYGMCDEGGELDEGHIFQFDPETGKYSMVKSLDGVITGRDPHGSMINGPDGLLYGATRGGGFYGGGTIFSFDPEGNELKVLFDLEQSITGGAMSGALLLASNGKLYGTLLMNVDDRKGVLFEFDILTRKFRITHYFDSFPGNSLVEVNPCRSQLSRAVLFEGSVLESQADSAEYQWIDCTSGEEVFGATSKRFEPEEEGMYQVEVTSGTCKVISQCVQYQLVGKSKEIREIDFTVYPNLTDDLVRVSFGREIEGELLVLNSLGEVVKRLPIDQDLQEVSMREFPSGVYLFQLNSEMKAETRKVILR